MTDPVNSYTTLAKCSADLCAFMLVCELGKLSAAAQVMNISQPSLSQRIKNLESTVGRQLFVRHSSGVDLTPQGKLLLQLLEDPLKQAATRFQEFQTKQTSDRVTISVDHAFASFWLLPRLPQLREKSGSTDICIVSSQDPFVNATPETDITIFMAQAKDVSAGSTCLLQEQVSAICSPQFLADNPGIDSPQALLERGSQLLHLNTPGTHTAWLDWAKWLAALNASPEQLPAEIVFNSYEMIIKAACQGQGIALGWHGLIDDLLAEAELVVLLPDTVNTDVGYYIELAGTSKSSKTALIRDWVVDQINT
ncbi:LysR family transcriptional regulator [Granulosicoccus antarcticus]|uniref:HTH-type transcriptional activator AmpR n=1 Tax=Granulosicoccus antarcticus IMCC3135 TaxID=1192854 RepID=A0A2Z2NVT8_9GAMM|nr:LysR family transcriptional regulator [Granulosicoccus antarcticus]ASJ75353.1 HTH-type transcriptional activator AmpR [Granulosicoccus antarcticus IMCC3135]